MKEKEFYLTQEGLARIKAEYDSLKKLRQSMLSGEDIPEALHSEELNPEYVHLHEDLNFLESKISEFEFVLKNYKPIKSLKGVVDIGSTVTVDIGGDESNFTIVETLEASPSIGRISKESPVGKALIGNKEGDEVTVLTPEKRTYKIKKIDYFLS